MALNILASERKCPRHQFIKNWGKELKKKGDDPKGEDW